MLRKSLIIDAHADTVTKLWEKGLDFTERQTSGHADLPRLLQAGVSCQVLALFTPPTPDGSVALHRILSYLDYVWNCIEADPRLILVRSQQDLPPYEKEESYSITLDRQPRLHVILGVEGGDCLAGDIRLLRILYRLGVRLLTLTWSNRNELADGVWESDTGGGLTRFGREVVAEMQRLGMIIDVSHLAPAGFWDVAQQASGPFIASHSNARAVCDHPRNLDDAQIRSVAEHGGVIGVNFCPAHLTDSASATIDDVVKHIEYLWEIAGEDHVGLGSDYDGIDDTPEGLADVTCLPSLIEVLQRRGHNQERLDKFLGLNFLRVFSRVLPRN